MLAVIFFIESKGLSREPSFDGHFAFIHLDVIPLLAPAAINRCVCGISTSKTRDGMHLAISEKYFSPLGSLIPSSHISQQTGLISRQEKLFNFGSETSRRAIWLLQIQLFQGSNRNRTQG
jgi:hypothetical protein